MLRHLDGRPDQLGGSDNGLLWQVRRLDPEFGVGEQKSKVAPRRKHAMAPHLASGPAIAIAFPPGTSILSSTRPRSNIVQAKGDSFQRSRHYQGSWIVSDIPGKFPSVSG
jgi:hypothetical protein